MQLSKRLSAVAEFVTPGGCLVDVGTDHGYVPIALLEQQKISSAIAMDVNRGPLHLPATADGRGGQRAGRPTPPHQTRA